MAFLLVSTAVPIARADETLAVGSKRFTESYILGEIIKQTADAVGEAKGVHKQGLGGTGVVAAALKSKGIDLYPEYTGTIDQELLKNKTPTDLAAMNRQLATLGLGAAVPLGFNNTYALAMRDEQAGRLGIRHISDLAKHPELKLGLSPEFLKRTDGWPGLKTAYKLPFADPSGLDHGLAYEAMAASQIDVMDIYSTDAKIDKYKLRVLDDDRKYFPRYDAVLLYRLELPERLPRTWAALQKLRGQISEKSMIAMNAAAELGGMTFAAVAEAYRAGKYTSKGAPAVASGEETTFLSRLFGEDFLRLTRQHLWLVFVSLAFSVLLGVPLGIWAARSPAAAPSILAVVGVIQTVPSLALLVFLIAVLHRIATLPALVALFLYALLPIVRNTYTGLLDIAPSLRESAVALGLPSMARLGLIELPLAARSILAGIKTSAVINVGTATIAALIGAGGFGERIISGYAINDNAAMLAGAIPAAALALLVQFGFDLLDRWLIPAGLRAAPAK